MNPLIVELHNQTMHWVAGNGGLRISDRIPTGYTEKLAQLVARRCIQVALDMDDPFMAVEIGDLFGIDK